MGAGGGLDGVKLTIGALTRGPAFPTLVGATATGFNSAAGSYAVAFSGSTTVSGELLILLICCNTVVNTPSGWTVLWNTFSSGNVFYKVADGSEGASVTVTRSGTSVGAGITYRLSNYTGTPELARAAASGTNPNPPSLSPSWGSAKTLWVAQASLFKLSSGNTFSSYPSGFSNGVNAVGDNGSSCANAASASLQLEASSDDPGTFAFSSGSASGQAFTIAVRGV